MSVTSHESAPSARQVKDYHVVVITRLPHFKRGEHSEEDVVQFMVGGSKPSSNNMYNLYMYYNDSKVLSAAYINTQAYRTIHSG